MGKGQEGCNRALALRSAVLLSPGAQGEESRRGAEGGLALGGAPQGNLWGWGRPGMRAG